MTNLHYLGGTKTGRTISSSSVTDNPPHNHPLDGIQNAEQAMNVLRRAMHDVHPDDLGPDVGVSPSTIRSIRSGRTKWPRPATFFGLIKVLDVQMFLVPRRIKR